MNKRDLRIKLILFYFDRLNLKQQTRVLGILDLLKKSEKPDTKGQIACQPSFYGHGFDYEGRLYTVELAKLKSAIELTYAEK